MKKILTAICVSGAIVTSGQDLAYQIPEQAVAVIAVKGEKLSELLTVQEFNQSVLGKKLLQKTSKKKGNTFNSIADFGISLDHTAYYYRFQTDSIDYNGLLFNLADISRFEQAFLTGSGEQVQQKEGFKYLAHDGDLLLWNQSRALYLAGNLKDYYIEEDSVRSEHYGIRKIVYQDYTYALPPVTGETFTLTDTIAEASYDAIEAAMAVDEAAEPEATETVPEPPVEESYPEEIRHDIYGYREAADANREAKAALNRSWLLAFAERSFARDPESRSVMDNPAYRKSIDPKAAASFYMPDISMIYRSLLSRYAYRYLGMTNALQGIGALRANLYLDKEQARIVSEVALDENNAARYKKIYRHKPNKKFARYINSEKAIGFLSYSFDTEAYLNEMPALIDQSFSSYIGKYREEARLGAELLSLLLDEKAVARVVNGDAVLVLSDVGPREYTYTTYEYDEDFRRREVKRTKTETLPDFLLMLSSDDTGLLERVLQYGIRHQKVSVKNGIYSLDAQVTKKFPFPVHILIKDGIIFCGTALRDLRDISTGHFQGSMSKEQRQLLLKSNIALYLNPKNLIGKLPQEEFRNAQRLHNLNTLLGNIGPFYMRSTGVSGNYISGESVATVPLGKENALQYFLSLIELASKLD